MRSGVVFGEAFRSLGLNRLRTALAMLGIVVGVAAVVIMVSISIAVQTQVDESIETIGSNVLVVTPAAKSVNGRRQSLEDTATLSLDDFEAIRLLPETIHASPLVAKSFQVSFAEKNTQTKVLGAYPDYFALRRWDAHVGNIFSDQDLQSNSRVAVLGASAAEALFGDSSAIDQAIRINGAPFDVIGVLERKGQSPDGQDQDDRIIIPYSTAVASLIRSKLATSVGSIVAQAPSTADVPDLKQNVVATLRLRRHTSVAHSDNFVVQDFGAEVQASVASEIALTYLLGAIGSVSLVVGGVGIMNIMLVAVSERKKEIGIRVALGATRRQIWSQFLIEAIIICGVGGALGIALAFASVGIARAQTGLPISLSIWICTSALSTASSVGLFFGLYPAYKASRMKPVDALASI